MGGLSDRKLMMMMFIGTETLVTKLVQYSSLTGVGDCIEACAELCAELVEWTVTALVMYTYTNTKWLCLRRTSDK